MRWNIKHPLSFNQSPDTILSTLIKDRGVSETQDPLTLSPNSVGLSSKALNQVTTRLKLAIKEKQPIIIYGDYDADGVTATAILWETLHAIGAKAYPFIPSRELHGYGLSLKGLGAAFAQYHAVLASKKPLVITVDNGITAFESAKHLSGRGIELIITDHHQLSSELPPHVGLLHSDQISGAGVAWFLAKSLHPASAENSLDLVTIGTIADMLPLTGPNRSLVKTGLIALRHTKRPGLKAIFSLANLDKNIELTPYHVNFILAPRLNAMGRLEHAIDSLRLLCTQNQDRAETLAQKLNQTNLTRQDLTQTLLDHALNLVTQPLSPILIIDHPDFHEGVIGLVAGKLAETYYRPTIIISRNEQVSKASARSVAGVNIIELIRLHEDLLINAGGHPMAAGFTIQTELIDSFRNQLTKTAKATIDPSLFEAALTIDFELKSQDINQVLFDNLQTLKPFGIGNPEPVFCLSDARVTDIRIVGKNQNHLKLTLQTPTGNYLQAIGFNLANKKPESISPQIAFTLSENTWNNRTTLQLILKDLK